MGVNEMPTIYNEPSRTFSEYLLIPNLTPKTFQPSEVDLKVPIAKFQKGEKSPLQINIPLSSAIMQAVTDDRLAIRLARCGGIGFIYVSQPIEDQAAMVSRVKRYKAGFVVSDSNLKPENTLKDVLELKAQKGHSTVPITEDGTSTGKFLGIVTSRDYRLTRTSLDTKIEDFMTKFEDVIYGEEGITLSEANDIIWNSKLNCLPILDKKQCLRYLVFRKDYDSHKENPYELLDNQKRLAVGAGINTHDYKERVPALVDAGADVLCIDSSDGFNEWQKDTISFVREKYGDTVKIGAGNVVDKEGFLYLVEAGADFVKVGIGGGSICITREQKGLGRGQATAVLEVAKARDDYFKNTGVYVPICSDGGIVHDYHVTLALAMGADFVMLGRYFARFDESPGRKVKKGNTFVKEYWGEGSNRARNWQRYGEGEKTSLQFEEGVDSYVSYAGSLKSNLDITLSKVRSTMCNCGALTVKELSQKARLSLVSPMSLVEGGAHDVILKEKNYFED
jgi:IMP dehydrogenase